MPMELWRKIIDELLTHGVHRIKIQITQIQKKSKVISFGHSDLFSI